MHLRADFPAHQRHRRPAYVDIEQSDLLPARRQPERQLRRKRRFPHAPFTRQHQYLPFHPSKPFRDRHRVRIRLLRILRRGTARTRLTVRAPRTRRVLSRRLARRAGTRLWRPGGNVLVYHRRRVRSSIVNRRALRSAASSTPACASSASSALSFTYLNTTFDFVY